MVCNDNKISTTAYFEEIDFHLKSTLLTAQKSVKICVAWINSLIFNKIFQQLNNRGIRIEIIYNDDCINRKNSFLQNEHTQIYPVKARLSNSLMHNKFCIIDDELLITGSFNWSRAAKNNFEHIIVIKNDYKLVKKFLHEFEDLKNFFQFKQYNYLLSRCCQCGSFTYNLGIFRKEEGEYHDSAVQIWEVCSANHHVRLISEHDEQYIHTWLLDEDEDGYEDAYSKDSMLVEFQQERKKIDEIHQYFSSHGSSIHAIGCISLSNPNEHIKYNENPTYIIDIKRSNMFYRKIIPNELDPEYNDEIYKIIEDIHW